MTLTIAPGLTLPLGSTPDGSPVALDLTNNPHTLLIGPCGSGKTVLLRLLAKSCAASGVKTLVANPMLGGSRAEVISDLEVILPEIARRHALFEKFNVSQWQDLPEEVRKAEAVQPIVILVDEYSAAVQDHNAEAERILSSVLRIVSTARKSGIHLVLIAQRPDVDVVPPSVREHLDNVIMMLRPGFLPGETAVAVAFRPEHREAALAAVHDREGKAAYGDAVIASTTGGVQRLNVPYNE